MSELNTTRDLLEDCSLFDKDRLQAYNSYMHSSNYSTAVDYLNDYNIKKGIRASVFNAIKLKIVELELFLLNLNASPFEYYSLTEPTAEEMEGKLYWIKPML